MKMRANERAARSAETVAGAHADLRRAFPPRPDETAWPASLLSAEQIIARIDSAAVPACQQLGLPAPRNHEDPGLAGQLPR